MSKLLSVICIVLGCATNAVHNQALVTEPVQTESNISLPTRAMSNSNETRRNRTDAQSTRPLSPSFWINTGRSRLADTSRSVTYHPTQTKTSLTKQESKSFSPNTINLKLNLTTLESKPSFSPQANPNAQSKPNLTLSELKPSFSPCTKTSKTDEVNCLLCFGVK